MPKGFDGWKEGHGKKKNEKNDEGQSAGTCKANSSEGNAETEASPCVNT